jgi:hypothetical protein
MPIEAPTAAAMLTVAGLSVIVLLVVEVIMRAWQPTAELKKRVGPLVALGVALTFAVIASFLQSADVYQAVLTAIVAGATSMGIYDTVTGVASQPGASPE